MPSPDDDRRRKRLFAAAGGALLLAAVLALLFWPESPDRRDPGALGMPGSSARSALGSRAKSAALFGSREGILAAAGPDVEFFSRVVAAVIPNATAETRRGLADWLLLDPEARRVYEILLKTGRIVQPEDFVEAIEGTTLVERLQARAAAPDAGVQRILVQGGPPQASPARQGARPAASAPNSASPRAPRAMSREGIKALNHIFSMVPPPARDKIVERMATGEGVWDACRGAGLAVDCNAAVDKCRADAGCTRWLASSGQKLPDERKAAGLTKTVSKKSVTRRSGRTDASAPEPGAGTAGSTEGGPGGGTDGGATGAAPTGGEPGGGDSSDGGGGGDDGGGGDHGGGDGGGGRGSPPAVEEPPCGRNSCQAKCGWVCGEEPEPEPASMGFNPPPPEPAPPPPPPPSGGFWDRVREKVEREQDQPQER